MVKSSISNQILVDAINHINSKARETATSLASPRLQRTLVQSTNPLNHTFSKVIEKESAILSFIAIRHTESVLPPRHLAHHLSTLQLNLLEDSKIREVSRSSYHTMLRNIDF